EGIVSPCLIVLWAAGSAWADPVSTLPSATSLTALGYLDVVEGGGDWNADGLTDLVASYATWRGPSNAELLVSQGDGSFVPLAILPEAGDGVATGDVDGDGDDDVVLVRS